MPRSITGIAELLAPKRKYRGGAWADGSEEIPQSAIVICAIVIFGLIVLWHLVYGNH